jgi:hypothetical protein
MGGQRRLAEGTAAMADHPDLDDDSAFAAEQTATPNAVRSRPNVNRPHRELPLFPVASRICAKIDVSLSRVRQTPRRWPTRPYERWRMLASFRRDRTRGQPLLNGEELDAAFAKAALREAATIALAPGSRRTKLQALNIVLACTKAKPAEKGAIRADGPETWLRGVATG